MRNLLVLAVVMFANPGFVSAQSSFRIEGQINAGSSLFPPAMPDYSTTWFEYGAPRGGFPVGYVARLGFGPSIDDWTFEFDVTDDAETQSYAIRGPDAVAYRRDLMLNTVVQTSNVISIDFRHYPLAFEEFSLAANLTSGVGNWQWRLDCPVCDLIFPLPQASATITSILAVPEPTAGMLVLMSLATAWTFKRRCRQKAPAAIAGSRGAE